MDIVCNELQFSILVVAYDRKEFILNAVNSALRQSLDKSTFEVIVIKNFKDERIDNKIADLGVRNVLSNKIPLGEKIIQGTLLANGKYICILEDDDQFSFNKLETIQKVITDDIVFIHNARTILDHHESSRDRQDTINANLNWFYVKEPGLKIFYKMLKTGLDFNCSSITIRKDFILRNKEQICRITYRLDNLLFLTALGERVRMIELNLPLTLFRLHDNSLDKSHSYNDFITLRKKRIIPYLEETILIFQLMQGRIPKYYLLCYNMRIKSQMRLLGYERFATKIEPLELLYGVLPKLPIRTYLYDLEIYFGSRLGGRIKEKLLKRTYQNALIRLTVDTR